LLLLVYFKSSNEILACLRSIPHNRAPINALDDDCLLNMFLLYRPALLGGDEDLNERIILGKKWHRERWWYKLAHVCPRWRRLILQSPSHLGLCLLFTHGTLVADMLAHSPPFPLLIDYDDINSCDRKGIMLALLHRDRVCRIRLMGSIPILEWLIVILEDEFPMLEYLCISPEDNTTLRIPRAFRAPQLRRLVLTNLAFPIGSPQLSAAAGLATLPNLRSFGFGGVTTYSEAFLSRITAPCLEVLQVVFFKQLTFSVSCLLQFMISSEKLRLRSAILSFDGWGASLWVYPFATTWSPTFALRFSSRHQLSTAAQIFNVLRLVFASVVNLALEYEGHRSSTQSQNQANRALWRMMLLRSFNNVKNLHVHLSFVKELFPSSLFDNGELPMDPLPGLKKLTYSRRSNTGGAFRKFIYTRRNAGHPVVHQTD